MSTEKHPLLKDMLDRKELEQALGEMIVNGLLNAGYVFHLSPLGKTTVAHALEFAKEQVKLITEEKNAFTRSRTVPAAVRQEVFMRDHGICHYCGTGEDPTLDHIIPFSEGGTHEAKNLVVACFSCNVRRNTMPYEKFKAVAGQRVKVGGGRPGKKYTQPVPRMDIEAMFAAIGNVKITTFETPEEHKNP